MAVAALRSPNLRVVQAEDHAAVMKVWAKRHRDLSRHHNRVAGSGSGRGGRRDRSGRAGEAVFGPGIADCVLALFAATTPSKPEPFPQLTDRERQVLQLLADGHPNAEIVRRLGTSAKTIRNHLSSIFTKIHVVDRTQAVLRARDAGYGSDD